MEAPKLGCGVAVLGAYAIRPPHGWPEPDVQGTWLGKKVAKWVEKHCFEPMWKAPVRSDRGFR